MANNPLLFNAALSGAFGGINTSRSITSNDPASYVPQRNSALTFATAVDAAIATDATLTQQEADLMFSICQQILNSKGSAGFSAVSIAAVVACFNLLRASLEAVPATGGGDPLVAAKFVDPATTIDVLQQDGSATKPFATIGQAISALPAAGGSVLLTPGVYPEEFPSVETPMKVSFVGLTYLGGECDLTLVDITTNSTVSVQNIGKLKAILLLAPGGSVISVNNCTVLNDCGVDSIDAKFSTFNGDIDSVNGVVGLSTSFQDLTSAGASNYFLTECGLVNANTTGQMGLVDCALQGNITVADITLKGCVSPAACTLVASSSAQVNDSDMGGFIGANAFFAPNLTIDTTSFQSFQEPDNVSFTNLTISDIKEPETVVQTFDQEDDFEFIGVADATAIPAAGLVLPTGRGNWNAISSLANGSIVTTLATAQDHAGVLGIRTAAATINAIAGIQKGNMLSASQIIRADQFRFFDAIVRVPDITTARVWFGYSSDTLSVTPTSAMYFVYDSSVSANWLAVTRSSGVEASSDTGVPVVAGTWYKLMIVRPNIASNLDFYINRANKTHVNTRVPATAVNLCFMGKTLTGAGARGFDIDWEKMQGNLVR